MHRVKLEIADVDRSVYESVDIRLARHPSESMRYLATRCLAYALFFEPGLAFRGGGVSAAEEPPIAARDGQGRITHWIEVGAPSRDRLDHAARSADHVGWLTPAPAALVLREIEKQPLRRGERVTAYELPTAFVDAFAARLGATTEVSLTRTEGEVYVTIAGEPLRAELTALAITPTGSSAP